MKRYGSESSLAVVAEESISGFRNIVSELWPDQTLAFENKYKSALREYGYHQVQFESHLTGELDKVNAFYSEKLEELAHRLSFLTENSSMNSVPKHTRSSTWAATTRNVLRLTSQLSSRSDSDDHDLTPTKEKGESAVAVVDAEEPLSPKPTKSTQHIKETESIQRALVDQYRQGKLLHNFVIMNYTGFVKIVKKHDKTFPEYKNKYKNTIKHTNVCNDGREVGELTEQMENLYAAWFCDGNVREARAQLLPKKGDGLQMDWSQLRLGYRLGMCAILTLWVAWDCIWGYVRNGNSTIGGRTAFPVFRGCGGLLLLHWFWGASVYVWNRFRINYIFLFDLDPRTVDSPITIFNDVVDETLVFMFLMLLYYKSGAHDIPDLVPPGVYPFLLVVYVLACFIFPVRTKISMWNNIWNVINTPFSSPTFFTIYIADVFTSMVKVFQDIAWTVGFIASGDFLVDEDSPKMLKHKWAHSFWYKNVLIPIVCLMPLWIRFGQCLRRYLDTGKRMPNLANALKYTMSQMVTLFGAFHPLYEFYSKKGPDYFQFFWMALFVSSSLYSFWWDVVMDWGLGRKDHWFLGPRLMFPIRSYYYGVMVVDLVLRFMWVLTLLPPQSGAKFEIPQYLTAVTMSLELMRRTLWGFFRLENEHRNNTEQYRRVSFVPLHFNTGHGRKYSREREHVGWSVLAEVLGVTVLVVSVSTASVIAAQRASRSASDDASEL